jgi:hypothetical protein
MVFGIKMPRELLISKRGNNIMRWAWPVAHMGDMINVMM